MLNKLNKVIWKELSCTLAEQTIIQLLNNISNDIVCYLLASHPQLLLSPQLNRMFSLVL